MKASKAIAVGIGLLLIGTGSAIAHGVRGNVGLYIGPGWGPWWYPSPMYYPAPVVVRSEPPPVYIERGDGEPEAAAQSYWYYCKSGKGYYPYVKECPEGWQKVLPQPEK